MLLDERHPVVGLSATPDAVEGVYPPVDVVQQVIRSAVTAALGPPTDRGCFASIVPRGASVLLKPNWVLHHNFSGAGLDCLVTHHNFVQAVVSELSRAEPAQIIVGDAPIQSCEFDVLAPPSWQDDVVRSTTSAVSFIDFRRTIVDSEDSGRYLAAGRRDDDKYLLFDLRSDSLLEEISHPAGRFRVTNYDPMALARTHRPGRHQYLLAREPFEADVIINLPKLKTHRKAGLTAALKNLVGINGNKDFLPHHRVGGSAMGGDCYEGTAPFKRLTELLLDRANGRIGMPGYARWGRIAQGVLRFQRRFGDDQIEGGWWGNDTVWRMALDLNRILLYGCLDATMSDERQRSVYSLTDGIIAGEGEGPLASTPTDLGLVTFADSAAHADRVHASLMHLDWRLLPLVREAFGDFRWPLVSAGGEECSVRVGGDVLTPDEAGERYGKTFRPPRGWYGRIEQRREEA